MLVLCGDWTKREGSPKTCYFLFSPTIWRVVQTTNIIEHRSLSPPRPRVFLPLSCSKMLIWNHISLRRLLTFVNRPNGPVCHQGSWESTSDDPTNSHTSDARQRQLRDLRRSDRVFCISSSEILVSLVSSSSSTVRLQGQREVRGHQGERGAVPRRGGPRHAPRHRRHLLRGRVDLRRRPTGMYSHCFQRIANQNAKDSTLIAIKIHKMVSPE